MSGTINGTTIGGTIPAPGTFTTLSTPSVNITGGTIENTQIGLTGASSASFTNLAFTNTMLRGGAGGS